MAELLRDEWKYARRAPEDVELTVFASCPRIIATFPALSQLAVRLLLLPIDTATCERSFSAMNRLLCSKRNQLTAEHLEQLMFISHEGPEIPHPRLTGAVADQAQNSYDDFVRQVYEQFLIQPRRL